VFPFFALLSARIRSDRSWLLALCGSALMMRCWGASILILPPIPQTAPVTVTLMLLAALAFLSWAFEIALSNDGRLLRSLGRHARAEAGAR
jgi:hypothetical protein